MLPINLLPNYINERGRKPKLAIFYGVVLAAIIGWFVYQNMVLGNTLDKEKQDLADATTKKSTYDAQAAAITKVEGQIAETKTKQTFIANAQTYNDAWPATYELIRDLTSHDVLLKSMALLPDHKTVTMTAFAGGDSKTAEDRIAYWWKALEKHRDIFDRVSMQIPTHPYVPPGAGVAGGGFGAPGGMPMSGGGKGAPAAAGMGMPGAMGMPGGMGMPGSSGSGGGAAGSNSVGAAEIEGRPGINFNATVILKTALANGLATAPSWPAGAAAGAGAPSSGMPMSGGGGMPMSGGGGGAKGRD